MKIAVAVSVVLYGTSLGLIGYGGWLVGGGDWRGVGLLAPGLLVWADLLMASAGQKPVRTTNPKKPSGSPPTMRQ